MPLSTGPFGLNEELVIRICERRGWDEGRFFQLPRQEQNTLLAFEYRRRRRIDRALELSKADDGKVRVEVATMRLILEQML